MKLFERGKAAEEDIYRRLSFDPQSNTLLDEIDVARREIDDAFNNFQNANYQRLSSGAVITVALLFAVNLLVYKAGEKHEV